MRYILSVLSLFLLKLDILAQDELPLFASDEILHLTMMLDVNELQNDRGELADYHSANIILPDQSSFSLKVKARGNSRRRPEVCSFPPLKLNFKKGEVPGTVFEGQDKIKLVTHCQDDKCILMEYLAYKTYEILSDFSLKVRLAEITYKDIGGNFDPVTRYAFFIEDIDHLAARHQGVEIEERHNIETINQQELNTLAVFQFMIGNADWDINLMKNIKLVTCSERNTPVAVPYDFDGSELIDATYIAEMYGVGTELHRRKFLKVCRTAEELEIVFSDFREKREAIVNLYENFSYLKKSHKKQALRYLDEFYKIIEDQQQVEEKFLACLKG